MRAAEGGRTVLRGDMAAHALIYGLHTPVHTDGINQGSLIIKRHEVGRSLDIVLDSYDQYELYKCMKLSKNANII